MKKLLSTLGALSLAASTVIGVVAWAPSSQKVSTDQDIDFNDLIDEHYLGLIKEDEYPHDGDDEAIFGVVSERMLALNPKIVEFGVDEFYDAVLPAGMSIKGYEITIKFVPRDSGLGLSGEAAFTFSVESSGKPLFADTNLFKNSDLGKLAIDETTWDQMPSNETILNAFFKANPAYESERGNIIVSKTGGPDKNHLGAWLMKDEWWESQDNNWDYRFGATVFVTFTI